MQTTLHKSIQQKSQCILKNKNYSMTGELAVMDANLEAEVTRPLTSYGMVDKAYVTLLDNGQGADVIPNDGIYSGYFTRFTLTGRYNVKVTECCSTMAISTECTHNYIVVTLPEL